MSYGHEMEDETAYWDEEGDCLVLKSDPKIARLPDKNGSIHEVRVWPAEGYLHAADLMAPLGYKSTEGVTYHASDHVHWQAHYQSSSGASRLISDEDVEHIVESTSGKDHLMGLTAKTAIENWATSPPEKKEVVRKRRRPRGAWRSRSTSHNNTETMQNTQDNEQPQQEPSKQEPSKQEPSKQELKRKLRLAKDLVKTYRGLLDRELDL